MALFLHILGLTVIVIALILFIAGYTTHYWMSEETVLETTDLSIGLWKMVNCSADKLNCYSDSIPEAYTGGVLTATIATASVVLAFIVITTLMLLLYTFTETARTSCMKKSIIFICIITVILTIVKIIIWSSQMPDNFYGSWSFGMASFGGIIPILAAFLLMMDEAPKEEETVEKTAKENGKRVTPPPPAAAAPVPPQNTHRRQTENPPQTQRTPSVPPFTPHWHEHQISPSPKPGKRYYSPTTARQIEPQPSTRRVISPTQIRVAATSSMSMNSGYSSGSSRRYGTPKYATRYDNYRRS